ncbi:MAG: hypothetical protein JO029_00280 [Candidatus Eremiobacteraeota bacterium]|nr:hypothetical protein [Candidatus Eremiobacteraeota bacterium]
MTESYVAGIFPTLEQADSARQSLKRLASEGGLVVYAARCYGRTARGVEPVTPRDVADSGLLDPSAFAGGTDDEAIDELNERLPEGRSALLAHVAETDPALVDDVVRSAGGAIFRRSVDEIEASGFHRFLSAASTN